MLGLLAMPGTDYSPGSELTPGMLFRELSDLRGDMRNLAGELRGVADAMLQFKTQDVATKLAKLEDGKIAKLEERMTVIERWQYRMFGAYGLFMLALVLIGLWLEMRN